MGSILDTLGDTLLNTPIGPGGPAVGPILQVDKKLAGNGGNAGGGQQRPAVQHGGGGGGQHMGVPHGVISFIRGQNPSLSKSQAAGLFKQYQASQKYAGLGNFLQTTGHAHDPATIQAFFAQTVAPYLNQVSGEYQANADAGQKAMQGIINNDQLPAAEKNVLQANLPYITSTQKQYGNALKAGALAGPAYDTLINQIQQATQQQAQTQAYLQAQNALGAGGSSQISNQGSAALAQLLKS